MSFLEITLLVIVVWYACAWLFSHIVVSTGGEIDDRFKVAATFIVPPVLLAIFGWFVIVDDLWPPIRRWWRRQRGLWN